MANGVYDKGRDEILTNGLTGKTLKVMLVKVTAGYTVDLVNHHFVSDVPAGDIIQRSGALTSVTLGTVGPGVVDAADETLAAVPTGHTIEAYIVYEDTGVDATSTLMCYVDHDGSNNPISLPTNGSDVDIVWNASGIFSV